MFFLKRFTLFSRRRIWFWSIFIIFILFGSIRIARGMSRPKNSLNIIFITIDTLRADHLGCYGYDAVKTPHIDRLAQEGILFSNAYSPSPLTFPSHVSMMMGQYPIQHGVLNNFTFELQDSAETLAEILKKSGYKTGAIVASYVLASHFGLNQGFDDYDDFLSQTKMKRPDYSESFRLGETVTDLAKKWLQDNYQRPFFLWVHYFDPHTPYDPPAPFDNAYKHMPYDGEIAYTDQCLGVLMDEIRKLSLLNNTCIILVGDHGEGLWEHNEKTHGLFIYDTTLKVPFIICYPKLFPKGDKVASLVQTIDIMPTTLDLLGIKSERTYIQGMSLIPLLMDQKIDIKPDLYCESHYSELSFNWAPLEGIMTYDGWKYIDAPKPELYHLEQDPHEKTNLLLTNPQKAESLKDRLMSLKKDLLEKSHSFEKAKSIALSPEAREKMQSLGYIAWSGPNDEGSEDQNDHLLPDPKDKVHLLIQIEMARELEEKGEFDQVIQKYEKILKEDPENKSVLFYAGEVYKILGQLNKALDKFQKLEKIDPRNYDCKNGLGLLYDMLVMPEQAIQTYKEGLQINPKIPYIHHNLGQVYLNINALDLAYKEFQEMRSLTQDPVVISMAIGNLGGIHLRQGHLKEALQQFKKSIKYNANNHEAHVSLADTYYNMGDIDQSIHEWKTIIDLWPDDHLACFRLAQLFLETKKSDQAAVYLKKCLQLRPDFIDARMLLQQIHRGISLNQF